MTAKKSNSVKNEVNNTPITDDVIDVSFDTIRKKKFRIDGDNNRILELNTSDLSVLGRIEDSYPKLIKLGNKASMLQITGESDERTLDEELELSNVTKVLKDIDIEMREILDYIFESNVSEICAPYGSLFDPINGEFRYEHIIDKLTSLYETNLNKEYELMKNRIKKHTDKYIGKR